jgi:hypothetical protein
MPADDREDRDLEAAPAPWRRRMHEVIFEADTPAGKAFDVALLAIIVLSVIVVMLDSVDGIRRQHPTLLAAAEWTITILFTAEYVARLICVAHLRRYALSFYGLVDLLAVVPTYFSLIVPGAHSLLVIRALRLIRVFRVFKLSRYLTEARTLLIALRETRVRITVFLVVVLTLLLFGDVPDRRGARNAVRQHPPQRLLGDRHDDHGGLRRHRARDGDRADAGRGRNDPGLRDHHRADRRVFGGDRGGAQARDQHPGVPRLRRRGARHRRRLLQILRSEAVDRHLGI